MGEQVYIKTRRIGGKLDRYHTDPGCPGLSTAKGVRPIDAALLDDDVEECSRCSGEMSQPETQDRSFYEAAKNA